MKKLGIFIIIGIALILSSCGRKSIEKEGIEKETSVQKNIDTQQEDNKQKVLNFVDVFGKEYTVKINSKVKKNPYIKEGFCHRGDMISYIGDTRYTSRIGIDVSHHQSDINWEKVKEQGIEFAFLRIGYRGYGKLGKICKDKEFEANIKNAQKQGIDVGVYFFSQAVNEREAQEEADFVIKNLENKQLQLPVVFDPENILDDDARTDNVSGEQFTRNTISFCKRIEAAGYTPVIYSNMLWEAYQLDLEKLKNYSIWYADYETEPQTPYYFEYWQYTNQANIEGIPGKVDMDIQLIPINNEKK